MIELKVEQSDDKWEFTALQDGEVIAELTAIPHEGDAVIHNNIKKWNKGLLPVYREMFADIREVLKQSGIRLIIPCAEKFDRKMGKFWRLMGFECFGSVTENGKEIQFAVMEA